VLAAAIVLVPLDDRPVTLQLPVMLGEIAGRAVVAPPAPLIGSYLAAGKPDAIIAWLNTHADPGDDYVVSSDMLAYGGLVASRVPGPSYADAVTRLRSLQRLRARYPAARIDVFGTVMRLAPTGVPAGTNFFAPYPAWQYLQEYANLHDPPQPDEEADAARLRGLIGEPLLDAYLQTRARNYGVDHALIDLTRDGVIDRLVLGQDDAKPYGVHVPDVQALQGYLDAARLGERASIEPGADELGMALVARALARAAGWTPHIAVRYSRIDGPAYQDPLEYAQTGSVIDALIALCGGVHDERTPDLVLYMNLPGSANFENIFLDEMAADIAAGRPVAVVDLSFEANDAYAQQRAFAQALLARGLASKIDAYAAWNTDANSTGTALAEAVAAGAGRRMHSYDALAHRTFTFMRFADDLDFHADVRPRLNAELDAAGVDRTLLTPDVAARVAAENRALLWNEASTTLAQLYPELHIAAMEITLPWQRTFETAIDVRLAPNLKRADRVR
jgi:hypothetical protein